jgi:hypothetical protein
MKLWTVRLFAFLCLSAFLEGQVNAPRPGFARYQDGFISSVFGLPGNFVLRASGFEAADAASFSDNGALFARNGLITLVKADGTIARVFDSLEPVPLLSITGDLGTAVAWLPGQHIILSWIAANFRAIEVDALPPGAVTSIMAVGPTLARLLITQANGAVVRCSISLGGGSVSSCDPVPGANGPAFEQAGFVVFKDSQGLEIQDQAGNTQTVSFPAGDLRFQRMSSDWIHIYSAETKQHWAMRLTTADFSLSQLPAIHPTEETAK